MSRIYLITHAHTAQQPDRAAELWELSPRGEQEAAQLAHADFWAEVTRIVVSAEPKTLLTVGPVLARHSLPVSIDCRFDEVRRGGWVENYADRVERFFAQPEQSVGEWECAAAARRRMVAGLMHQVQSHPGATLAVVGHGLGLSLLRAHIARLPVADFDLWRRLGFAAAACITVNPDTIVADFVPSASTMR